MNLILLIITTPSFKAVGLKFTLKLSQFYHTYPLSAMWK